MANSFLYLYLTINWSHSQTPTADAIGLVSGISRNKAPHLLCKCGPYMQTWIVVAYLHWMTASFVDCHCQGLYATLCECLLVVPTGYQNLLAGKFRKPFLRLAVRLWTLQTLFVQFTFWISYILHHFPFYCFYLSCSVTSCRCRQTRTEHSHKKNCATLQRTSLWPRFPSPLNQKPGTDPFRYWRGI